MTDVGKNHYIPKVLVVYTLISKISKIVPTIETWDWNDFLTLDFAYLVNERVLEELLAVGGLALELVLDLTHNLYCEIGSVELDVTEDTQLVELADSDYLTYIQKVLCDYSGLYC